MKNKNPFRDFAYHARRIHNSKLTDKQKETEYKKLFSLFEPKLKETQKYLNSSPAFSTRCAHWNQINVDSISTMNNSKNPWLSLKREFSSALSSDNISVNISKALAWFYSDNYLEDWIAS